MNWAIYRIHYGIDFIKDSINSIINDVDRIFIFYSEKPWVETDYINYKNQKISFPKNPENIKEFLIKNFNDNKISIHNYECNTPLNQYGKLYDLACNLTNVKPKYTLFIEPDMIFGLNQFKLLKLELNLRFWINSLIAKQIEIWKFNKDLKNRDTYRIPLRKRRIGPVLWKIKKNKKGIITEFGGAPFKKKNNFSLLVKILNMGFSFNKETMFYKHLLALVFSKIIDDSVPCEMWYEEKWLNWNVSTKNLGISKGGKHLIKKAYRYKIPKKYYI